MRGYFAQRALGLLANRLLTIAMNGTSNAGLHQSHKILNKTDGTKKFKVCIEGNIACGKTTLLNHFLKMPGVEVFQEPVDMWRNVRGYNPLGEMYKDPKRWSMALQTYIQLTMLDLHTKQQKEPVRLMERSIHSARYLFVENLYRCGNLSDVEFVMLDEWYQWIIKTQDVHVDLYVYLQTSPETCLERLRQRCRNEEMGVPLELLQNLHKLQVDWLIHKRFPCEAQVLVLDADDSLSSMFEKYREQEDIIMGKKMAAKGT